MGKGYTALTVHIGENWHRAGWGKATQHSLFISERTGTGDVKRLHSTHCSYRRELAWGKMKRATLHSLLPSGTTGVGRNDKGQHSTHCYHRVELAQGEMEMGTKHLLLPSDRTGTGRDGKGLHSTHYYHRIELEQGEKRMGYTELTVTFWCNWQLGEMGRGELGRHLEDNDQPYTAMSSHP